MSNIYRLLESKAEAVDNSVFPFVVEPLPLPIEWVAEEAEAEPHEEAITVAEPVVEAIVPPVEVVPVPVHAAEDIVPPPIPNNNIFQNVHDLPQLGIFNGPHLAGLNDLVLTQLVRTETPEYGWEPLQLGQFQQ